MLGISSNMNEQKKGMNIASLYLSFSRVDHIIIIIFGKQFSKELLSWKTNFQTSVWEEEEKSPKYLFEFVVFPYLLH